MEITLIDIRKSAENLISGGALKSNQNAIKTSADSDRVEFSSSLASQYLVLQGKLSNLQMELTMEQTRLALLEDHEGNDNELVSMMFGSTRLFPPGSLDEIIQDKARLVEDIEAKRKVIAEQIRAMEVESENVLAAGGRGLSNELPKIEKDAIKGLGLAHKSISGKSVEKLITG